jgi:hypothetical protein
MVAATMALVGSGQRRDQKLKTAEAAPDGGITSYRELRSNHRSIETQLVEITAISDFLRRNVRAL